MARKNKLHDCKTKNNKEATTNFFELVSYFIYKEIAILQMQALNSIAYQNPYFGGSAVYSARVMLNISVEEVVMDGPFFQSSTTKQPGCQIDYMIQTRFHNLYLCEVKFKNNKKQTIFGEKWEESNV